MNNLIVNEANYGESLATVEKLILKGSQNLTQEEEAQLETMALAIEKYEDDLYGEIPPPSTSEGIAELEMYRARLKEQRQG